MKQVTLGKTNITTPQNGFGALPIQRVDMNTAVDILHRAYEGGMTFFDTARAYSDSEEKLGVAFNGMREKIFIASKTMAKNPEDFWIQLDTTLTNLKTDYLDIYQLHCVPQCYEPGDGTGMYECLKSAKQQGIVKHIGVTAHNIETAFKCVNSGLYETMQFPFSYLCSAREIELVNLCKEKNVGFIAMKGLAGGLIHNSNAAMAYISQYDNVLPIWGIQKMEELEQWLQFMDRDAVLDQETRNFIAKERTELVGEFCRGCGYCMPCPQGILINNCARMSLMLRRAPSKAWLTKEMQAEMAKIENCINCGKCKRKCPYELDTPELLRKNLEDYKNVLAGKVQV